jgi:signal peptidase
MMVFDTMKTALLASETRTSSPSLTLLSGDLLSRGLAIRFRAPGTSMHPTIRHGDVITVAPVAPANLKRGDIILYRFQSDFIAHRIVNIETSDRCELSFILRGDASATCDSPVKPQQILGKVVCLERYNRSVDPYSLRVKLWSMLYLWLARLKRGVLRQWQNAHVGDKFRSREQGASSLLGTKH